MKKYKRMLTGLLAFAMLLSSCNTNRNEITYETELTDENESETVISEISDDIDGETDSEATTSEEARMNTNIFF